MPPRRERRDDVRLLFEHFLERFTRRHRARPRRVESEVYSLPERYDWPGNVRELRSLCERLVIFGGDPVTADQLPSAFFAPEPRRRGRLLLPPAVPILPLREFKARAERKYIESVLQRTRWNVSAAARLLGVQRTYLHQKVRALGARRPPGDGD